MHRIPDSYKTTVENLYSTFKTWAEENGHRGISSVTFAQRVRTVLQDLARTQPEFFCGGVPADHPEVSGGLRQIAQKGERRLAKKGRRCPLLTNSEAKDIEVAQLVGNV